MENLLGWTCKSCFRRWCFLALVSNSMQTNLKATVLDTNITIQEINLVMRLWLVEYTISTPGVRYYWWYCSPLKSLFTPYASPLTETEESTTKTLRNEKGFWNHLVQPALSQKRKPIPDRLSDLPKVTNEVYNRAGKKTVFLTLSLLA